MRTFGLISFMVSMLLCSSGGQSQPGVPQKTIRTGSLPISGDFVGLEPMESLTPEDAQTQWFHENTFVVRDNEAILDKVPVTIKRGVKTYSASDGGFATYRGRFLEKDGAIFVSLRLFESMYIISPTGGCEPYSRVKVLPVEFTAGRLVIDGIRYKAKRLSKANRQRLLRKLGKEPMEYTGERPYRNDKAPPCQ